MTARRGEETEYTIIEFPFKYIVKGINSVVVAGIVDKKVAERFAKSENANAVPGSPPNPPKYRVEEN